MRYTRYSISGTAATVMLLAVVGCGDRAVPKAARTDEVLRGFIQDAELNQMIRDARAKQQVGAVVPSYSTATSDDNAVPNNTIAIGVKTESYRVIDGIKENWHKDEVKDAIAKAEQNDKNNEAAAVKTTENWKAAEKKAQRAAENKQHY